MNKIRVVKNIELGEEVGVLEEEVYNKALSILTDRTLEPFKWNSKEPVLRLKGEEIKEIIEEMKKEKWRNHAEITEKEYMKLDTMLKKLYRNAKANDDIVEIALELV